MEKGSTDGLSIRRQFMAQAEALTDPGRGSGPKGPMTVPSGAETGHPLRIVSKNNEFLVHCKGRGHG